MAPLALVILLCSALPGSSTRDHCEELRIPIVVDALPTSCVLKAQEFIATHPHHFENADIRSIGCSRRREA